MSIKLIVDQIDTELNLSPEPNMAYIRGKVEELKQEAPDEDYEPKQISRLQSELDDLQCDYDDLEWEFDSLRNKIKSVIKSDLSNEDKLSTIKTLIED